LNKYNLKNDIEQTQSKQPYWTNTV